MTWVVDTLVWTGALIAFALLARRPVARHFGASTAYALWALPLLRLALPPIRLPAWLAPSHHADTVAPMPASYVVERVAPALPQSTDLPGTAPVDWATLLVAAWLAGAAVYIVVRLVAYARMREGLLEGARSVGEVGSIRLIETPAASAPLAFGVRDKVIALPMGFMAWSDRAARDLALEHELSHHRAGDLAANFAALPLFALHWFNPLSTLGWNAMRRDQEAACDARVVRTRTRSERALYARVIAVAAAAPRGGFTAALAAPMACPVLGDKSIVHRLRTLTLDDPTARRRRAGLWLVSAAALALPMTASISYAADGELRPPVAPAAPTIEQPGAPSEPTEPEMAIAAPSAHGSRIMVDEVSHNGGTRTRQVYVYRTDSGPAAAPAPPAPPAPPTAPVPPAAPAARSSFDNDEFAEDMRAAQADVRAAAADVRSAMAESERMAKISRRMAVAVATPVVVESCNARESVSRTVDAHGQRVVRICTSRVTASATAGLRSARAEIARDSAMSASVRADILATIDSQIADLARSK